MIEWSNQSSPSRIYTAVVSLPRRKHKSARREREREIEWASERRKVYLSIAPSHQKCNRQSALPPIYIPPQYSAGVAHLRARCSSSLPTLSVCVSVCLALLCCTPSPIAHLKKIAQPAVSLGKAKAFRLDDEEHLHIQVEIANRRLDGRQTQQQQQHGLKQKLS